MRYLFVVGFFFFSFIFSGNSYSNQVLQAEELMAFFGSTCPTQGEWTKAALGQSLALINVLESVKNDNDCKSLNGAMTQLNVLSTRLQSLDLRTIEREIYRLKRQERELVNHLAITTNLQEQITVRKELRDIQVELAGQYGYKRAEEKFQREDERESIVNLVLGTQFLLNQSLSNQACLLKYPSLLTGLTSLAGAVAAGVASPAASLGIAAGVELLDSVVEYARKFKIQKQISAMSESVVSNAFQCVLESLSNQWCTEQDALNIVQFKAKKITSLEPEDEIWKGIKILDYELPLFIKWLQKVRAGNPATTIAEARNQQRVFQREAQARSAKAFASGILLERKPLFDKAQTVQEKWSIERALINDFLQKIALGHFFGPNNFSTDESGNLMSEIHTSEYAPYFLLGLSEEEAPKYTTGGFVIFSSFNPFSNQWPPPPHPPFVPNLTIVEDRLKSWIDDAERKVANELTVALQPVPLAVLTSAALSDNNQRSPITAIEKIQSFLTIQPIFQFENSFYKRFYEELTMKVREILEEIYMTLIPGSPYDPKIAISEIYQKAQLNYGTVVLEDSLSLLLRIQLLELVFNQRDMDPSMMSQLIASQDIISELERFGGSSNLTEIYHDIRNAQMVTEETLQNFSNLFEDNINDLLEKYEEKEKGWSGKYGEARARLCFKLLSVPKWPEDIDKDFCEGAQLVTIFPGGQHTQSGPSSFVLNTSQFKRPYHERACAYRDYFRASKIFQRRWEKK